MKQISIIVLFAVSLSAAFGQELSKEQAQVVAGFIDCIKYQKKEKLIQKTFFPLNREYPIPPIKNSREFLLRYNEVFDDALTKIIANSQPVKNWSAVGSRGIMLSNGLVWLDLEGKLIAVNYQSSYEAKKKEELIEADRRVLHQSIKDFNKPVHILETKTYLIRIDDLGDENFRYASWRIKSKMSNPPDVIIKNGKFNPAGSGGNHSFVFRNKDYTYECMIIVTGENSSPPAYLKIYKGKKQVLSQRAVFR